MKRTRLSLLTAIFLVSNLWSAQFAPSSKGPLYKDYVDSRSGFRITVPADWEVGAPSGSSMPMMYLFPKSSPPLATARDFEYMQIGEYTGVINGPPSMALETLLHDRKAEHKNYALAQGPSDVKINGNEGISFIGQWSTAEGLLRTEYVTLIRYADQIRYINFISSNDVRRNYGSYSQILNSYQASGGEKHAGAGWPKPPLPDTGPLNQRLLSSQAWTRRDALLELDPLDTPARTVLSFDMAAVLKEAGNGNDAAKRADYAASALKKLLTDTGTHGAVVPRLVEVLRTPGPPHMVQHVGEILNGMGSPALQVIRQGLNDPDELLRQRAVQVSMQHSDKKQLLPDLENLLKDPNELVRQYAELAIDQAKGPAPVEPTAVPDESLTLKDMLVIVGAALGILLVVGILVQLLRAIPK